MARSFDGIDDVIDCLSPATLDNINTYTWCAWVFPVSAGGGNNGRILQKGSVAGARKIFIYDSDTGLNRIQTFITRATTDAIAFSVNDTMVLNAWQFVATTYDETDGPRIFRAAVDSFPAEVTYATRTVGVGATSDESADNWFIGNRSDSARSWDGRLANIQVFSVRLSVTEMSAVMRGLPVRRDAIYGDWPLHGTVSPEPDWSGNNNHGTVTGAIRIDHPPGISAYGHRPRKLHRGSIVADYESILQFDAAQYTPAADVRLEVVMRSSNGNTVSARLYNITDGVAVTGGTITTASTTDVRLRSGILSLTGAKEYRVEVERNLGVTTTVSAARLIVQQ